MPSACARCTSDRACLDRCPGTSQEQATLRLGPVVQGGEAKEPEMQILGDFVAEKVDDLVGLGERYG